MPMIIIFQMPKNRLSHDDCLKLVCAVCTNLHGMKANRGVSEAEAIRIQKFVFKKYQRNSPHFPQGLCNCCHYQLWKLEKEQKNQVDMRKNKKCLMFTKNM